MKLYDLYQKTDETSRFLMRAPVATIAAYLDLHYSAVKRIERETSVPGGICSLHDSKTKLVHLVQAAVGSLGETL